MKNDDEEENGLIVFLKIIGIIFLVGIIGGISYNLYTNVGKFLKSDEYQTQILQEQQEKEEKIKYEMQKNCDHKWLTLSEWDETHQAYKIYSECSICGKAVK